MNQTTKTPLYGHINAETAYLVADYPYGRKVRCRIRYWLEQDPKRGFRFVAQTENPKTLRWNAPKKSTYVPFAAVMYLDEVGHVQWKGLGPYADHEEVLAFVQTFPGPHALLGAWAVKKAVYLKACLDGKAWFTINGVKSEWTDADKVRHAAELEGWNAVIQASKS